MIICHYVDPVPYFNAFVCHMLFIYLSVSFIYIYISIFVVIFELILSFKTAMVGGGNWSYLLRSQSKLDSIDFILETIALIFNSMSPF